MSYKIVIPSYNRAETLLKKTITLIDKHNIPAQIVYIFVANEDEKQKYSETLPEKYIDRIIIGVKGMKNIRNFITDYFGEDEQLFYIDDDVVDIFYLNNENKLEPIRSLDSFITLGFSMCKKKSAKLFSIYPVQNPYFMKNNLILGLSYCMGGVYGVFNNPKLKVSVDNKEDFERSIQYFINGNTLRFNNVCCGTKGYSGAGGMKSFDRTYVIILEDALKVVEKYGNYCKLNLSKKSGKPEIKIKQIIISKEEFKLVDL